MKAVFLIILLFSLLLPAFVNSADDHTNGRGARQFMRDAVNENKSVFEQTSLSLDDI